MELKAGPQLQALLTTEQAAQLLGMTVSFLRSDRVRRKHSIPYVRIGSVVRYRCEDLTAWISKHVAAVNED